MTKDEARAICLKLDDVASRVETGDLDPADDQELEWYLREHMEYRYAEDRDYAQLVEDAQDGDEEAHALALWLGEIDW